MNSIPESGVYFITNTLNGKAYIGSSINCAVRIRDHIKSLRRGTHRNRYIQSEWNEFGESAFVGRLTISCDENFLKSWEQLAIDGYFSSFGRPAIYNSQLSVQRPSQKARAAMSEKRRRRINSPETNRKISESQKNRAMPEEQRRLRIGNKSRTGMQNSLKTRLTVSMVQRGLIPRKSDRVYPYKIDEAVFADLVKTHFPYVSASVDGNGQYIYEGQIKPPKAPIGKRCNPAVAEANRQRVITDETRAKLSAARRKRIISQEQKDKASATMKETLAKKRETAGKL